MPDTYDELFGQLERNVETLKSDTIGLPERIELFRESRTLVERCASELDGIGAEIEELRLDELLTRLDTPSSFTAGPQPPPQETREVLLRAWLLMVGRGLALMGETVSLANLAAWIEPERFAQMAHEPVPAGEPDIAGYLEQLTPEDEQELRDAATRLGQLADDPLVVEWFGRAIGSGGDVYAELANAMVGPAGDAVEHQTGQP
ncbi:MAG: exodeoxyribonuclease small subunit [Thermoleophilaceae bacterium]|nr:exodeoxyribonuclease small subunit [Thermoleophilaceae bacterium]